MEEQVYHSQDNILFQDNKICILVEKNGKVSRGKMRKHINIRHFFITSCIKKVRPVV